MSPKRKLTPAAEISASHARGIVLRAQGLDRNEPFGSGREAALRALKHLGYVQIDTISVVERAHHHVLWSRVPDYRPSCLHELQSSRTPRVFEYWTHAASYLPFSEYRFSLPRMRAYANGNHAHWTPRDNKTRAYVLDRIRAEGPLQARDFEAPPGHRGGTWFEWKPAKRALEQLATEGALMVRERRGFQKIFDLTERVVPSNIDTRLPSPLELARHLVTQSLRSNGLAREQEIAYLRKHMGKSIGSALRELEESGHVVRVKIGDVAEERYAEHYALSESLETPPRQDDPADRTVRILSPFDNLVIQRQRLKRIFGFDYQIECYVPEAKRRYGYFALPVLWGDRLVGRIDAKAVRDERVLQVHGLYLEKSVAHAGVKDAIKPELGRFAAFNGCDRLRWKTCPRG